MNADRFILNRRNLNIEESNYWLQNYKPSEWMENYLQTTPLTKQNVYFSRKIAYLKNLQTVLDIDEHRRILPFTKNKREANVHEYEKQWPVYPRKKPVIKPQYAVLDLPNIQEDIIFNVVHWGATDYIAAALENIIYLWHVPSSTIAQNIHCNYQVSAIRQDNLGLNLAISSKCNSGKNLMIWNIKMAKVVVECRLEICDHQCSYNSIDWYMSNNMCAVGCEKGNIAILTKNLEMISSVVKAHDRLTVMNVKFSPDGHYLATSGKDGKIKIWSVPHLKLIYFHKEHYFSKGLAWHPWRSSYLCYGTVGGTIALMNTSLGKNLYRIEDKNSIVYNLCFNKLTGELVISHTSLEYETGRVVRYSSQINVLARLNHVVDRFIGHSGRILYLEWNPEGNILATAGTDETIYLWKFIENYHNCLKKKNITLKNYNFI